MKLKQLLYVLNKTSKTHMKLQNFSTATEIEIPRRIHRSPTDILKAIANTYQRDPTAAHYKYHDDPYLIPYSNFMKRSYALSQESGRKAAQWIRQQHADLFQHKVADPLIEAYIPKPVYTEDSEVTEKDLQNLINNALVSDAITVYNALKKKGSDVSITTKESFFQFLCYFNSEDPLSEDWIEERWFRLQKDQKNKNTWSSHELVEELFNELKSSCPSSSYSALICGMCQHGAISKAMEVYEEAQTKVIPLNVEAFNALLGNAHLLRESYDLMWKLMKDILVSMNHMNIDPNVRTLNGVLQTLSKMFTYLQAKRLALQTLAEFQSLNINPSLATYFYLLEVYYKDKPKLCGLLAEILNIIEDQTFTIEDPNDTAFFVRAMEICSHIKNKDLGYRLHNILLKGNNYNFIGEAFKESVYYRNFFFLLANTEPLVKLMEFYDKIVPSIYVPEAAVVNAILKGIADNLAWDILPKLWSDIVLFELADISGVLENTLMCTANNNDLDLNEKMSKIAWNIWERMEGPRPERTAVQWTGTMLGNAVLTFLKGNDKAKAHLVMDKLVRLGSTAMNEPPVAALKAYVQCCIEDNAPDLAIKAIQFCDDVGFVETSEFAQLLNSSIQLTDKQREKLAAIVGADCLKVKSSHS